MPVPAVQPEPEAYELFLEEDDEPQGCVLRVVELPDGSVEEQELPLTLELLLHPQEGDKVTRTDFHFSLLVSVVDRLRRRLERVPGVGVFSDLLFKWDRPGLKDSGPDIAVVRDLPARRKEISEQIEGTFDVATWGTRPHLAIEVVSPEHGRLRRKDLKDNLDIYAKAGIEEYLIIHPIRLGSKEPLQLLGYRLGGGSRYAEIQPDAQGRILLQTTGLLFWSDPGERRIEIFDQATGERLLTSTEEAARADAAEERLEQEAAARQAAEARVEEEAAARQAAEARARAAEEELERLKALSRRQD